MTRQENWESLNGKTGPTSQANLNLNREAQQCFNEQHDRYFGAAKLPDFIDLSDNPYASATSESKYRAGSCWTIGKGNE